jgi:TetR/AcrR family tetracycline transcriptional repressor
MARQRLNLEQIVDKAIGFVDEYGFEALTVRRLGDALDVSAMAMYRHVTGRAQLLEEIVRSLVDRLFDDPLMKETPNSWEDYIQRVANVTRNLALEHPKIFPLIATQPPEAPWLRPPLRSVRWVENFLETLKGFSFTDVQAVRVYKSFTSFLLGALLLEVATVGAGVGNEILQGAKTPMDTKLGPTELDRSEYPTVYELRELLEQDQARREFDDALDDLIERICNLGISPSLRAE